MKSKMLFAVVLILCCSAKGNNDSKRGDAQEKEVVCFVYHRFGDSRYPTTNTPIKDFESHLTYLKKNNFTVITFSDAITYLRSNRPARKTAVITIDDAYKTFFKNGLPILKKYGMPATLFINTKNVGAGDYMSWLDLEVAVKNKIEVGNHTHTHSYFLNEPATTRYETFKREIELSQSIIIDRLKIQPTTFSYPYGEFDEEMKSIVKAMGFKGAAAQNSGIVHAKGDLYMCPRFPMSEAYSTHSKFVAKANMKALRVLRESPNDFMMPKSNQPTLTLTIDREKLQIDKLQCFVQGGKCDLQIIEETGENVTVTLKASRKISSRRRALYTLTAPGKHGGWYWHSHLWINDKIIL